MALTSAQMLDVRRFAGYQAASTVSPLAPHNDIVYQSYGMVTMSLYTRLTTLDADAETVLISKFIEPLNTLEDVILTASDNLDTDVAAVWTRNKNEVRDRAALLNNLRVRMCEFLGMKPGPNLINSGNMVGISRA